MKIQIFSAESCETTDQVLPLPLVFQCPVDPLIKDTPQN